MADTENKTKTNIFNGSSIKENVLSIEDLNKAPDSAISHEYSHFPLAPFNRVPVIEVPGETMDSIKTPKGAKKPIGNGKPKYIY